MFKEDKRKYSICIVSGSKVPEKGYYKHLDELEPEHICIRRNKCEYLFSNITCDSCDLSFPCLTTGEEKALEEAQRLANLTNKKVTVLTSVYNVYPENKE